MSEWIEHIGRRRKVHRDEKVTVKFRCGSESLWPLSASDLDWVQRGHSSDIVAYRIHQPSPSKESTP